MVRCSSNAFAPPSQMLPHANGVPIVLLPIHGKRYAQHYTIPWKRRKGQRAQTSSTCNASKRYGALLVSSMTGTNVFMHTHTRTGAVPLSLAMAANHAPSGSKTLHLQTTKNGVRMAFVVVMLMARRNSFTILSTTRPCPALIGPLPGLVRGWPSVHSTTALMRGVRFPTPSWTTRPYSRMTSC